MHPKQMLAAYNLEPKKSLGQNFLFDSNILSQIADLADISPGDSVLEIGPGLGSLTAVLAERAAHVTAVEIDDRFLPLLQEQLAGYDNVRLIHGDILQQDMAALFDSSYKVVANVPYYITGAILRHLLASSRQPSLIVLTVQKEVADRMTAAPPNMSLLSVSVQYYGKAQALKTIKAGAFWPRPDVDSAVVRLDLYQRPNTAQQQEKDRQFFKIVRAAFSQKRKQLQKNLRQLGLNKKEVSTWLNNAGVDGKRRAETLSLDEWRAIQESAEH